MWGGARGPQPRPASPLPEHWSGSWPPALYPANFLSHPAEVSLLPFSRVLASGPQPGGRGRHPEVSGTEMRLGGGAKCSGGATRSHALKVVDTPATMPFPVWELPSSPLAQQRPQAGESLVFLLPDCLYSNRMLQCPLCKRCIPVHWWDGFVSKLSGWGGMSVYQKGC